MIRRLIVRALYDHSSGVVKDYLRFMDPAEAMRCVLRRKGFEVDHLTDEQIRNGTAQERLARVMSGLDPVPPK